MAGKLYVVGTPIGNMEDLSPRALRILNEADFIAAEDTRVTLKILNKFSVSTPLVSYHEHNETVRGMQIIERILNGESCALVTDAGMPAISDPGEILVRLCYEHSITVESVPGPTAFATAMAISGMPSCRFTFEGFLSVNKRTRSEHLASIADEQRTMIFYEAPHKLLNTLKDLYKTLGDRTIAICREITKIHEDVWRTTLSQAVEHYRQTRPMGEFVLVIEGKKAEKASEPEYTLEDAVSLAVCAMENGESASNAAKSAAAQTGLKKGDIYKELTKQQG